MSCCVADSGHDFWRSKMIGFVKKSISNLFMCDFKLYSEFIREPMKQQNYRDVDRIVVTTLLALI